MSGSAPVAAVVFDLDGVLLDSEPIWNAAREQLVRECGGRWHEDATLEMMGMSSTEWSRYLHDRLGVPMSPDDISRQVMDRVQAAYTERLPLLPHAIETVEKLAVRWPLGLASSSNRPVIEQFLHLSGLRNHFEVVVSSEEVARGKPAPDVYLAVARALDTDPASCAAVEDSANGIKAAVSAGMRTIAVPNRQFPPDEDVIASASAIVHSLADLTPDLVEAL